MDFQNEFSKSIGLKEVYSCLVGVQVQQVWA